MFLDAVGKACPIPVVLAKKELDGGCTDLVVAVDNPIAVQNLTRLASGRGLNVSSEEKDGVFHVHISGTGTPAAEPVPVPPPAACGPQGCGYAVFIGKDHLGEGEQELGYNLLRMALFTLSQGDAPPASVLFMNGGVRLPAGEDPQVLESLKTLEERGTAILVCGTCLNYYGLTEKLAVGSVSNMYTIVETLARAGKVIRP